MAEISTDQLIDQFLEACDEARQSTMPGKTKATRARAIRLASQLKDRQTALERDITEMWKWLATHEDHPRYAELDQIAVERMNVRDRIEDALNAGWHRFSGGRSPVEIVFDAEPVPEPPRRHPALEPIAYEDPEEMALGRGISARMREHNDLVACKRSAQRSKG